MLKLLESFKKKIWKSNLDNQERADMYKEISLSLKAVNQCLDVALEECKGINCTKVSQIKDEFNKEIIKIEDLEKQAVDTIK